MIMAMVIVHGWHTRQLDYVLASLQTPVEKEIYMKIPKGFRLEGDGDDRNHVLKIHKNIYGQKQAGRVWNHHLTKILTDKVGFKQSSVDDCVFYRGNVVYALYTDDSILAGPDNDEIEKVMKDIKTAGLKITDEGTLEDFLGVNIERQDDGTINLTQPHLIDQIINNLRLGNEGARTKVTPTMSSKVIKSHNDSPKFDESFHYRSVIGKLNYLERCSRPDISYTTINVQGTPWIQERSMAMK